MSIDESVLDYSIASHLYGAALSLLYAVCVAR